jgi:hypothetical protein
MAKVFIALLAVVVVLNGMTFLIVVNQAAPPTEAESPASPAGPRGPATSARDITQLKSEISSLRNSLTNLTRKVDDLSRKLPSPATISGAVTQAINAALAMAPEELPPEETGGPPAGRTGPVDYSRVPAGTQPVEDGSAVEEEYPPENSGETTEESTSGTEVVE